MEKFNHRKFKAPFFASLVLFLYGFSLVLAAESSKPPIEISGYLKSLNFFTKTSGLNPEVADNPLAPK